MLSEELAMEKIPFSVNCRQVTSRGCMFFPYSHNWQKTKFDVFASPLIINTIPDIFVDPEQPAHYP